MIYFSVRDLRVISITNTPTGVSEKIRKAAADHTDNFITGYKGQKEIEDDEYEMQT